MKKYLKNVDYDTTSIVITGLLELDAGEEFEIPQFLYSNFAYSDDLIQAVRDGLIQVGYWAGSYFTDPLEGEIYLRDHGVSTILISDGTSLEEVIPGMVGDTATGRTGISPWFNIIMLQKELYNAEANPLYDSTFTPLTTRTSTVETIHNKLGWHDTQVKQGYYQKPKNVLFYYGWTNSFNSGDNGWSNEKVAQDMAKNSLIILGDGIQDPGHGDHSNATTIIGRIKDLKPEAIVFGYVTVNQSLTNFKTKVDQWVDMGVTGIFMDEGGYDYGSTATNGRAAFNAKVDYVHGVDSTNSPMTAFVNAWNMDHIIGTVNDGSYPNSTWNPDLLESTLTEDDWYLLESFTVHTISYTGDYATGSEWNARGEKAVNHRFNYGINLAATNVIDDDDANGQDMFDFCFVAACMYSLDAVGSSDEYYGASSATCKFWDRSDVTMMGPIYDLSPTIEQDGSDSDVYWRYTETGRFKLDFSSGAQTSSIDKF